MTRLLAQRLGLRARAAAVSVVSVISSISIVSLIGSGMLSGCYRPPLLVAEMPLPERHALASAPIDTAPKEAPRLVPSEAYMRTYLQLFGGLLPLEVQRRARGGDGGQLFDTWGDYLAALGFPDYRLDLPRAYETNALMVATFERLGDALCDRAVEYDLRGLLPPPAPAPLSMIGALPPPATGPKDKAPMDAEPFGPSLPPAPPKPAPAKPPAPTSPTPPPIARRVLFAFDLPKDLAGKTLDIKAFAPRFDVLHRSILGYPERLAPAGRTERFFALYQGTLARHAAKEAPRSRFSPTEAAWATVCYGLIRHPEFHFY